MTTQTIPISAIDEDRKFWRAAIEAIGEDPLRVQPGRTAAYQDLCVHHGGL